MLPAVPTSKEKRPAASFPGRNSIDDAEGCVGHLGFAQPCNGVDCRHMLRRKARSGPARPNPDDPDWRLRQGRQSNRHPEELAAAFAMAPVDLDHGAWALSRCRRTLSTSTKANAVNEIRTVSSQSRGVSGSVWKTPCRNGV